MIMPDFNELLNSAPAKRLMGDQTTIDHLKSAPETQRLMELLNQHTGGNLSAAAGNAAKGDSTQLMSAMQKLLNDPESKRLLEQIKKNLPL